MRNTVDIHNIKVGNFYKFVDETTGRRIEFIGYVCNERRACYEYEIAVLQSNDNDRFINMHSAMAYIEVPEFKGDVYPLDNPKLTYDIIEPTTNTINIGRR